MLFRINLFNRFPALPDPFVLIGGVFHNPLNAILFIENPDGVDSVSSAKIEDNAVTFYLDSTHTQYVGVSRMQLRLFDQDGCAITLPHFTFEIRENIYGSGDVRFQNVVMVDQTGTVILTEDNDLLDVGDILTMGTEVAYPQVAKTIKELPIKDSLDGTEKLIVEDDEATKQVSLETVVNVSIGKVGSTNQRPVNLTGKKGMMYYDLTLDKPVWVNQSETGWVDATGQLV